ncbi:MAG TPA: glycosyltransferase [Bryobacteraceae bacterium]|nr:glycosyltransferase [Bryobacteraceae bacterium]
MATAWPILLMVRELGIGGCERDLTKIAIGLDRERFEPHVATFHPEGLRTSELRDAGIPILHLPVTSFQSPSAIAGARKMGQYMRQHGIRLVHSYDAPMTIFGVPAARFYRAPVVISSQLSYRALAKPSSRRLLRLTDHLVDRVVVNCEAMRDHMVNDEHLPRAKTYLCYNGVDTQIFYPGRTPVPEPLAGAPLVIGSVCGLRAEKRLDLLVDAFARVHGLLPGTKLAIVGSGVLLGPLEEQAKRLGVRDSCVFQPAISDVAPWMRAMDIFVLPSESEAFSNALLEAMACGCCPIGSRVGGTPELIANDERGLIFDSGDSAHLAEKLAAVIVNPELRRKYAAAAAKFAHDRLSIEIAVERMSELYAASIERRPDRTASGVVSPAPVA